MRVIVGDLNRHQSFATFPSALLESDSAAFKKHLKSRSAEISSAISQLFNQEPASAPDVSKLQGRMAELLATEKSHIIELERSRMEKEKLLERLEDASLRYMLAEKKLDRSKSATVAKLEKQAIAGGRNEAGSVLGGSNQEASNGLTDPKADSGEELIEAEVARKQAVAESAKRKEQLESLEVDNGKLTAQITTLNNRLSHLSDDDYSRTDLFKHLKTQHEDVIKRINDLEFTNIQLREEAQRLQAERTAYRVQLERESQKAIAERENQLAQLEADLARIRGNRDELIADQSMRKAAQSQEHSANGHVKEMANAKEDRIKALEAEIARLKLQSGNSAGPTDPLSSLDGLSMEEVRSLYSKLQSQWSLLSNELQSMESALKKTSAVASTKVANLSSLEEKSIRLSAEKSRADQKYFAAMKAKEARELEVRTLRTQNSKSSEMVSALKDSEAANRALQVNLEKQVAELQDSLTNLGTKHRASQQQTVEKNILLEGLKAQVAELKRNLEAKDTSADASSIAYRKAEVEIERLKAGLEETKKSLEAMKTRGLDNQSGEYEMLRVSLTVQIWKGTSLMRGLFFQMLAICTVCHKNFKNTAIKTCGHVLCNECVEERTTSRSRKCPNCNKAFGLNDVMRVTL